MIREDYSNLSRRDQAYLARAMEIAKLSTCRQKHGAIVVRGGRVLAVGVNRDRNHPRNTDEPSLHSSTHAEVAACRGLGPIVGATLYVARVNATGNPLYSRPCDRCHQHLLRLSIKRVVYTLTIELQATMVQVREREDNGYTVAAR